MSAGKSPPVRERFFHDGHSCEIAASADGAYFRASWKCEGCTNSRRLSLLIAELLLGRLGWSVR